MAGRAVLLGIVIALVAAVALPLLAILFWQKVIVPLAYILKWKRDDEREQLEKAKKILKEERTKR